MITKKPISRLLTALILMCSLLSSSLNLFLSTPTYAVPTVDGNSTEDFVTNDEESPENPDSPNDEEDPDTEEKDDKDENEDNDEDEEINICKEETMSVSWLVCGVSKAISKGIDAIYGVISDLLTVRPVSTDSDSAIFQVWKYIRDVANTFFVIAMLIVICSQLTGFGISNYGVKRVLPRLIIAAIAVNLSFFICSLAVDVSNIAGGSLRNVFIGIKEAIPKTNQTTLMEDVSFGSLFGMLTGGAAVAGLAINSTTGFSAFFWILLITMIAAIITVIIGLVTIAARQGLVAILIMISPLAFMAYLLPNTESWFKKWSSLFSRMLVFYPMFSILFGASELIGWTLMVSGLGPIWVVMGLAIQILPLILSVQLMKMSGTVLGSLNSALTRATAPLQSGIRNWGMSHADQHRQAHLATSSSTGAHLRRYLDYKKELRTLDTKNSEQTRANIAATRAYQKLASSTGRDIAENDTWKAKPNKYTRRAKIDSLHSLRADTAKTAYSNTISAYRFNNNGARKLSSATAEAFIDYSTQQFRAKNEAQSDQTWLLDQYLAAATHNQSNPTRYNRLIRNGAGSLQHLGESSIMGQVISENVAIEERRRREARVIANKFPIDKQQFRAMVFNKKKINDDGKEINAVGEEIEDDQFRIKKGYENQHREWDQYIVRHETTGDEISKEEYDKLSPEQREHYNRIRYTNIYNDKGEPVQQVYIDDAGYMKELLGDDIAIGDPINQRYAISLGVSRDRKQTGSLRKYYSTIIRNLQSSGYKEHAGEMTSMLLAQIRNGYIQDMGQYYIAALQSIKASGKPKDFLVNDPKFIKNWGTIVKSVEDEELFKKIFPDASIDDYRGINGGDLAGCYWGTNEEGYEDWIKVAAANATLEQKKNYIKHILIPEGTQRIFGFINREVSPNIRDNQKPGTADALVSLLETIVAAHDNNNDDALPIDQKLNPNIDLFDGGNPEVVKQTINKSLLKRGYNPNGKPKSSSGNNGGNDNNGDSGNSDGGNENDQWDGSGFNPRTGGGGGGNNGGGGNSAPRPPRGGGGSGSSQRGPSDQGQNQRLSQEDAIRIEREVKDIFYAPGATYDSIESELKHYFRNGIFDRDTIDKVDQAIYANRPDLASRDVDEMIYNDKFEQKYIENLSRDVLDIVASFITMNR